MANTKEIKSRMKSVQDTQKITSAMYLIASTKMRRAKAELDDTRPYFEALKGEIKRVFRSVHNVQSRYFYPGEGEVQLHGPTACLVITADKGLAGMYNQNVIKKAEQQLADNPDTQLFVVGEYGRQYFARHHTPIAKSFLYTAQNPTMQRAREISEVLLDLFDTGKIVKIYVIYTDMKNGLCEEAHEERLLPFRRQNFASHPHEAAVNKPFKFEPSVEQVLDNLIPSYVSGYIYSALVDSFCSEQNARMTAMNSANQNAEKILAELNVEYNRIRQAAITQEITEVSAGALAQKRNRQKKQKEVCGL